MDHSSDDGGTPPRIDAAGWRRIALAVLTVGVGTGWFLGAMLSRICEVTSSGAECLMAPGWGLIATAAAAMGGALCLPVFGVAYILDAIEHRQEVATRQAMS